TSGTGTAALCNVECCFFSSRRRHTRSKRDWSSDVCSSDLCFTECLIAIVNGICTHKMHVAHETARFFIEFALSTFDKCFSIFHRSEERRVGKECRWWWWEWWLTKS